MTGTLLSLVTDVLAVLQSVWSDVVAFVVSPIGPWVVVVVVAPVTVHDSRSEVEEKRAADELVFPR